MTSDKFSDVVTRINAMERELREEIKSLLGVAVKVTLVAPDSIARSEGKAKRVIDKRK